MMLGTFLTFLTFLTVRTRLSRTPSTRQQQATWALKVIGSACSIGLAFVAAISYATLVSFPPDGSPPRSPLAGRPANLFGIQGVPELLHPGFRRLEVIAMTERTAAIRWPSGSVTTYRELNKPAFGPVGDSLDDIE